MKKNLANRVAPVTSQKKKKKNEGTIYEKHVNVYV